MYAFIYFWLVIIVLLLRDSKHISPCDNISKQCLKQKFGIETKSLALHKKYSGVDKNKLMLHKKVFHAIKKKFKMHKKRISCPQKQDDNAKRKYFLLKKTINSLRNITFYFLIHFWKFR